MLSKASARLRLWRLLLLPPLMFLLILSPSTAPLGAVENCETERSVRGENGLLITLQREAARVPLFE